MIDILQQLINDFLPFAKERMGYEQHPRIFLSKDQANSQDVFGKTAYYDPQNSKVVLYITNRHPKDIMRSLSHELVHHAQNSRGEFDGSTTTSPGYAQEDSHLRGLEEEAYLKGNMCFRDYEDQIKKNVANKKLYKEYLKLEDKPLNASERRNQMILESLAKKWGMKIKL